MLDGPTVSLLSASEASEAKPEGMGPYLRNLFVGWSPEIHDIVGVTKERTERCNPRHSTSFLPEPPT